MVTVIKFEKLQQGFWRNLKLTEEIFIINTTVSFVSTSVLFTYLMKLNVLQLLVWVKQCTTSFLKELLFQHEPSV